MRYGLFSVLVFTPRVFVIWRRAMEQFKQQMHSFFTIKLPGSPQRKASRGAASEEDDKPPVTRAQAEWMRDAVHATFDAFGGHVESKFKEVDEWQNKLENQLQEQGKRIEKLEKKSDTKPQFEEEWVRKMKEVKKEVEEAAITLHSLKVVVFFAIYF